MTLFRFEMLFNGLLILNGLTVYKLLKRVLLRYEVLQAYLYVAYCLEFRMLDN